MVGTGSKRSHYKNDKWKWSGSKINKKMGNGENMEKLGCSGKIKIKYS